MSEYLAVLLVVGAFCCAPRIEAAQGCVLPVPDVGGDPNPPNLRGRIVSIALPKVRVRNEANGAVVAVKLPESLVVYSAFGGDTVQSELRVGQHASIWYQGCKFVRKETPFAAYFQIYSLDPVDQPMRKPRATRSR